MLFRSFPLEKHFVDREVVHWGAQARAAVELIERAGGVLAGIAAIAFRRNAGTAPLWERYRCHSVWPEQA